MVSIGVKPRADLAVQAGLEIGQHGGIRVNEYLQTSDPNIWAVAADDRQHKRPFPYPDYALPDLQIG
jgi:thioredoxin reductase